MAATDFVTETQIDSLVTNIATAVKANTTAIGTKTDDTAVNNHIADATAAHAASAISILDSGSNYVATDVEAALAEVYDYAETKTDNTAVNNHIADATAAHAASAISIVDSGALYAATDVEAALAEVRAVADAAAGGGVVINDLATNTSNAWSSQKITDHVSTAVAALIDGAPGALDTLNELAAAINDDATFTTTVTTALGLRVRVDAVQNFNGTQQLQGRQNIGVISSTVDFASNFNTAIA